MKYSIDVTVHIYTWLPWGPVEPSTCSPLETPLTAHTLAAHRTARRSTSTVSGELSEASFRHITVSKCQAISCGRICRDLQCFILPTYTATQYLVYRYFPRFKLYRLSDLQQSPPPNRHLSSAWRVGIHKLFSPQHQQFWRRKHSLEQNW